MSAPLRDPSARDVDAAPLASLPTACDIATDEVERVQLLRRFLTGLLMALVALLPGASHASVAAGHDGLAAHGQHAHRHDAAGAPVGHAHAHHAAVEHALVHGHDAPPCRHDLCKDCAMVCCAPAVVGLAASAPVTVVRISLLRPAVPAGDRRHDDASRAERLRPPISL